MAKKRKSTSRKTTSSSAGTKARRVSVDAQAEGQARTRKQRAVKTSTQPQLDTISIPEYHINISVGTTLEKQFLDEHGNIRLYEGCITEIGENKKGEEIMRIEYSDGDNEHPTKDELEAQIEAGLIDIASIKNANDADADDEDSDPLSQSQAVDSPTCESTGCCSGAPRPNFVPDHILDSANGENAENDTMRAKHSTGAVNTASQDDDEVDLPHLLRYDSDDEDEDDYNEFPQRKTHGERAPSLDLSDEDYKPEEDPNEFSGDKSDEVMNEHSGEVGTLPLVQKSRAVIVRWITEALNLTPCTICNQPFMTKEMYFYYKHLNILHGRKIHRQGYMHPQCCTQICAVHGLSNYVCADHMNFLRNCVSVENATGELIPLHEDAELFNKLCKILQKNFYADADVVKFLPKVHYYDSKDKPNVESSDEPNVEPNVESRDEPNVESSDEPNVESSNKPNVEKWELEKILTTEEILHHNSEKCSTNNCKLPACTRYVNTVDETNIWYGCIDCQYKEFGGWPNKTDEFPVEFFAEEDLDTMKDQCSSNGSFEYPLNIPIKTSTGEFVNFESNECEGSVIPAYRNKLVVCGKPVLFEGVSIQKRNDRNDDVFFCDCGFGECWEILQKNTSSYYQDKDYLVAYCKECDSRPMICKKCHRQFGETTYPKQLEGKCQDNQKIIPNVKNYIFL